MSSPVSDMKWNSVLKELCELKGGARWYSLFNTMSSKNEYIDGEWHSVSCADFDESVYYSSTGNPGALTYDIDVCTFPNDVKLVLSLFYTEATHPNSVIGYARLKYQGQYTNVPSGFINGFVSGGIICSPAVLRAYGIKFALLTDYTGSEVQTAGGVVENVTSADYISITVLMPFTNGEVIQSWSHIHDGTMCMSNIEFPEAGYTLPDGFYYPNIGANPAFVSAVFKYTDFDDIVSDVQDVNPNIPFTKDDIISTGTTDPTQEDDPSTPGGGGGGYDGTSDPIDFPNLPRGGALASGGCRAYRPTAQEIKSLMGVLWNTSVFDISTFQKLVDNPMDAIIGLHALPVTPISEQRALHVFIGNFNTEIAMDTITNQYLTVDCGYLDLKEFWGSALDYSPYTKIAIYLPFIGIKDLTIDDVMPKNVRVKYNIDVLTGDCIAFVKCGTAILYKFAGNMKQDIPLTGQRSDVQLRGLVSTMSIIGSAAVGSAVGGGVGGGMILGATASGIGNVASSKITTQRSGALGGNVGVLDEFTPYLIIHRPVQSLANNFKSFKGYPSNITRQLSGVSGYTEVEYVNLQNIPNATSAEMDEIKNLLNKGVLI